MKTSLGVATLLLFGMAPLLPTTAADSTSRDSYKSKALVVDAGDAIHAALDNVIFYLKPESGGRAAAGDEAALASAPLGDAAYSEATTLWHELIEDTVLSSGTIPHYVHKLVVILNALEELVMRPLKVLQGYNAGRVRDPIVSAATNPLRQFKLMAADKDEGLEVAKNLIPLFSEDDILQFTTACLRVATDIKREMRAHPDWTETEQQQFFISVVYRELTIMFPAAAPSSPKLGLEIENVVRIAGRHQLTDEEAQHWHKEMSQFDLDKDGFVTESELVEFVAMESKPQNNRGGGAYLSELLESAGYAVGWYLLSLVASGVAIWVAWVACFLLMWSMFTIVVWELLRCFYRCICGRGD